MDSERLRPFLLYRDQVKPLLDEQRPVLEKMYHSVMGRPQIDPVLLMGITLLQFMEGFTDRQAVEACLYDIRWRIALELADDWPGIHSTNLCHFRSRLNKHGLSKLAMEKGLEAMRQSGYLHKPTAVRIDSTHVLANISRMSRLECVRETLRLALNFLVAFEGPQAWAPWVDQYAQQNPKELRDASEAKINNTMRLAGIDIQQILKKADNLGRVVAEAQPILLLRRVFAEQFECRDANTLEKRPKSPSGSVQNPHDPQAQWSTKGSLGKAGWTGYKLQISETVPETIRKKGEPTTAVITAVVTQPAITSDHGSITAVLNVHKSNLQQAPNTVFTDAGYTSAPALEKAQADGYELCAPISTSSNGENRFGSDAFDVNLPEQTAICPAGKRSQKCSHFICKQQGAVFDFFWSQQDCSTCPLQAQCFSPKLKTKVRELRVGDKYMLIQERRRLCKTPEYQMRMRRRNAIEGTNSEAKRCYGIRNCRYRGLDKTSLQMQMFAAACNLRRWSKRMVWLERQNTPQNN